MSPLHPTPDGSVKNTKGLMVVLYPLWNRSITSTLPVPAVVVQAAALPVPASTSSTTNTGSLTSAPSAFVADPGSDAFILHTSLPKVIEGFLGVPSAIYSPG